MADTKFWETKSLDQLSEQEWESLCDGCGLCCLHKLEDDASGDIVYTAIACRLLDTMTCRCQYYAHRRRYVPGCIQVRGASERDYASLPPTCAYRLRWLDEPLPDWHPLVSGDPATVHTAGISVRDRALSERDYAREIDVDAPLLD
ncbi:MAG: YcgN family cysteine cluster protein [Pseudomonadota bacterium]